MSPRCRSASGSVRNSPKHHSAKAPREAQVFWPLSTPAVLALGAGAARLRMPARSLPASGSDHPWHQISSPRGHGGQEPRLLLVGAELEEGRGEQEDPVLAHPQRGLRPPVLLLEDQPLDEADPSPAVLLGPRHDRPPVGGHGPLPAAVGLEPLGRVERGQGPGRRGVGGQPRPGLGPELLLVVGESKVHRSVRAVRSGAGRRRAKSDTPPDFRQPRADRPQWGHAERRDRRRGPDPGREAERPALGLARRRPRRPAAPGAGRAQRPRPRPWWRT